MELSLERKSRRHALEFCKKTKENYDKLLSDSPEIPRHIITEFNIIFTNIRNKPDVANGLFEIQYEYIDEQIEQLHHKDSSFLVENNNQVDEQIKQFNNNNSNVLVEINNQVE